MTLLQETPPVVALDLTEPVHFIGIGGAGMSALARVILARGGLVTGSDMRESETTRALQAEGARVFIGHAAGNVGRAGRVIYSAAIKESNPELVAARERGIPTQSRAALLGDLMRGAVGIAIAGTHGKTTTTGMVATMLCQAGYDPTVLIGGDLPAIDGNARIGTGPHFVAEACEAFHSFLELSPRIAVVTNIEADHLDCHGSLEGVVQAFEQFLDRLDPDGAAILCWEDARVRGLRPHPAARTWTYGLEKQHDVPGSPGYHLRGRDLKLDTMEPEFTVDWSERSLGTIRLGVPGRHSVLNALAAAAVGLEVGLSFEEIRRGLGEFRGTGRRFEVLGEPRGIRVIDDYAHHPTEVAATLEATKQSLGRPTIAVFQPHLYSRTQLLLDDFARSFARADRVVITEIYAAREEPMPGVSGARLVEAIQRHLPGKEVHFIPAKEDIALWLAENARAGDVVLTLGAGDIREAGEKLVRVLSE
jgi:UDP-N-acetylmuramate--alanine ligase